MKCPNCKTSNNKGHICKNCGINITAFLKSIRVSNLLYNKGLARANQGELSHAIQVLQQSIKFNKNNYVARNLLGLVYYEVGQIGDALKQWILSSNMVKANNLAMIYMQRIQNNPEDLYGKNDAIIIYNQALSYVSQKNDDMAIIQLKKALEINPNLVKAINLLTFCYLIQNNKDSALELIKKTLLLDKTNKFAINYHITITGKPPKRPDNPQKTSISKPISPPSIYNSVDEKRSGFGFISLYHILSFLIGGVVVFGMLFFFVMPGWVGDMEQQISTLNQDLETIRYNYNTHQEQSSNQIVALQLENEALQLSLDELQTSLLAINQEQSIAQAQQLVATNQLVDAAEILYNINMDIIVPEYVSAIEVLKETAFGGAAFSLYNEGLSLYNQGNFEIAIGFFERSLRFAELSVGSSYFMDDAIYFLGRIAQHQGNYDWAITLFNEIINDYPNSNVFNSATARLSEVEASIAALANTAEDSQENIDEL